MIFTKPIDKLNFEDVKIFCEKQIKEGFHLDYKKEFPSDLAKTISAFANTFGGVILIGIEEDGDGKPKLPITGISFEKGLDLRVMNIILENINPPVFPEIGVVEFTENEDKRAIVIIRTSQSNETPHTINNKKSVYIRTENRNKPEEIATIEQIEWLWNRRKKSEDLRHLLYKNAEEKLENVYKNITEVENNSGQKTILPNGLKFPKAQSVFSTIPLFPNKPFLGVVELRDICNGNDLKTPDYFGMNHSFPFSGQPQLAQQSVINYYFSRSYKELLFYEFNIYGLFFYQEPLLSNREIDFPDEKSEVGTVWFYRVLARIDQFLDVAVKFYDKIGFWGLIEIKIMINDILGLKITKPEGYLDSYSDNVSYQKNFEITKILTKQELKEKRIDILKDAFREVCLTFNFEISEKVIDDYLRKNKRIS